MHSTEKHASQGSCVCVVVKVCQSSQLCILSGSCSTVCIKVSPCQMISVPPGRCSDDDDSCEIYQRVTVSPQERKSHVDYHVSLPMAAGSKLIKRTDGSEHLIDSVLDFGPKCSEPGVQQTHWSEWGHYSSTLQEGMCNTESQETVILFPMWISLILLEFTPIYQIYGLSKRCYFNFECELVH